MDKQNTDYENTIISDNLQTNIDFIKNIFKKDSMLRVRQVRMNTGLGTGVDCCLFYFDGMVDSQLLNDSIVFPLQHSKIVIPPASLIDYIEKKVLFAGEVKQTSSMTDILRGIEYGDTALFVDGYSTVLIIDTKGFDTRGISEPEDERILQGPREGFKEAILYNTALLRRKLQTPDLCIEAQRIGRRTDTKLFICYLESLVDLNMLAELKARLSKIDIDGVLDVNYLSELIRDHPCSPFKTTGVTERPDIVAARLLEGRIAVMVDGTPAVLTIPYLFVENFQSDEDYYLNYLVSSIGRILRFLCFFLAISIPALYLSLVGFHEELLPTMFALSVAQARGGVPLSSLLECVAVIVIFEILKETGVRMPQSLGHALAIVGGLIIGQAAVDARLVSAPVLIAVALSGVCGLMVPRLRGIVFYARFVLLFLGYLGGLFGFMLGISALFIMIFSLKSFGVDCTISLLGPSPQGLKDLLWRSSWRKMRTRPAFSRDRIRAGENKQQGSQQ
ncbi:MAG: spore germination protein [Eubacteriales bacterium]